MDESTPPSPFLVKDCTLATIALGQQAQNLIELRDRLTTINPSSIYYHFWESRLGIALIHREYHNDFSQWAHRSLRDDILAERLDLLDPTEYPSIEALRSGMVEILENRLGEVDFIPWAKSEERFHFLRSNIVVFSTRHQITKPEELVTLFPKLTNGSLFYHMIDARRRVTNRSNDFSLWLMQFGDPYKELQDSLNHVDPYFISLTDLQNKISQIAIEYFIQNRERNGFN